MTSGDMFPDSFIDFVINAREKEKKAMEICNVCGSEVQVAIFRNTGICSENCRKIRDGEIEVPEIESALLTEPQAIDPKSIT